MYLNGISKSVFNYHGLDDKNLYTSLEEKINVDPSTETTMIQGVDVDRANREIIAMIDLVSEARYDFEEVKYSYSKFFRKQVQPALLICEKISLPPASSTEASSPTSSLSGLKRQRPEVEEAPTPSSSNSKKSRIFETFETQGTSSKRS